MNNVLYIFIVISSTETLIIYLLFVIYTQKSTAKLKCIYEYKFL